MGRATDHGDEFQYHQYPDFLIMAWNIHPATARTDFDTIARSLPDFKQGIIAAAEFMYQNESKVLDYVVVVGSELHEFQVRLTFPYVQGQGDERELFHRKRILSVGLLDRLGGTMGKLENRPFAKVLDWDLKPFKCDDQW